ncbi:hypothetical protein [Rhodoferax sp.]|uniref:hypothetical protein n=1 Tax=Rhodoferax sp. TaxID=50421 RepID=UPI00262569A9|nr:hypothetical protein [Rhodoferax sp.]MDD2810327.1 hypothetical protein [Rhodoferax sp.]MDD4960321.1 hypothetical protein [Gallionella sp.]
MNENFAKEDQDWLDTLAGKSPEGLDPILSAQALAVRTALISRRDAIEANAAKVGDSGLEKIRERLMLEGLMDSPKAGDRQLGWLGRALSVIGMGSSGGGARAIPIWGVAATLLVAVVVVTFQVSGPQTDEALVYRGDPNAVILIVEKPELRASEIVAGIKAVASDDVDIHRFKDGIIRLQIKDSQTVRDYLLTQRIETLPANGVIKIDVVPVKK